MISEVRAADAAAAAAAAAARDSQRRRTATSRTTLCVQNLRSASPPRALPRQPPAALAAQGLSTTRAPARGARQQKNTPATRGSTTGSGSATAAATPSTDLFPAITPTMTPRRRSTWGAPCTRTHSRRLTLRSAYFSILLGVAISLGVFLSPPKRDPFIALGRVPGTGKPGPEVPHSPAAAA